MPPRASLGQWSARRDDRVAVSSRGAGRPTRPRQGSDIDPEGPPMWRDDDELFAHDAGLDAFKTLGVM
jgi:hypothetical protein